MSDSAPDAAGKFWVQTRTGLAVDLIDTRPEQICAEDLAVQLARIPRWNGATIGDPDSVYSVASHSVLVSRLLRYPSSPALRLAALLHDGAEAYTGDMPSPVKWAMRHLSGGVDPFKLISEHVQTAIHRAVGLTFLPLWHDIIKRADMQALALEDVYLMAPHPRPWIEMPDVSQSPLAPLPISPRRAANEFMLYLRKYIEDSGVQPMPGFLPWP